jgi:hypothetical protein
MQSVLAFSLVDGITGIKTVDANSEVLEDFENEEPQ